MRGRTLHGSGRGGRRRGLRPGGAGCGAFIEQFRRGRHDRHEGDKGLPVRRTGRLAPGRRDLPHADRRLGQPAAGEPPGVAGVLQPQRAAGAVGGQQRFFGRDSYIQITDDARLPHGNLAREGGLRRRGVREKHPRGRRQTQPDEDRDASGRRTDRRRQGVHGPTDGPVAARHTGRRVQGHAPGAAVANPDALQGLCRLFVRRRHEAVRPRGAGDRLRHDRRQGHAATDHRPALLAGRVESGDAERQIHRQGLRKER